MASVSLRNVKKVFDKKIVAACDINLDIADKEFVVLVGPSGCGKSTTLRMIAGLEEVTEGEIYIDNKLVNDVPPKDRDIAMVFQNYALYPHMTVYDNMAFGLKLRKFSKQEIKKRVLEAASILGITDLLDRKPKALSGGQRQRVAVGRAIVRKPKVFLFDEPLSNLDAKLRVQMRTEISKLHSTLQATMIYVTHDQVEAMTMGDRIVVMKDGYIQQIDDPLSLYDNPSNRFVAGFIGSPAMNFADGVIQQQDDELYFIKGECRLKIATRMKDVLRRYLNNQISLGIRPEDIFDKHAVKKATETVLVNGVVDVVEPMGNEIFLYFTFDDTTFVARLDSRIEPRVNTPIEMLFDMNKVHFFDPVTDKTII